MARKSGLSRRSFLKSSAAAGAAGSLGLPGPALAQEGGLPDPDDVLADISVEKYVKPDYQKLYDLSGEPLWDPAKDWIRNVDWEAVRKAQSGRTVRFAIGAADKESAADGLEPFEKLSGITVELVPIPDANFYDKAITEFISGNASFDALQFFSAWLGDFAAPGFLADLQPYADKWSLPLDDFYEIYRANFAYYGDKLYGIPYDCDIQMVHLRDSLVKQVMGGAVDKAETVPTYDELVRLSGELGKVKDGVAGLGLLGARGFWAAYTWEHIAAQAGMMLFDEDWTPTIDGEAGQKGMDILLALNKNAAEGVAGWGWGENRSAWLGGQVASDIAWQDSGIQAMRPDQSQIVGDFTTIYEPRIEGGRFAPPIVAGSTSCVSASSQNPEGAFLTLAFLTTSSIMAMNTANANGVAPGYKSVLSNERWKPLAQPAQVWADSLPHGWCAPRIPGLFEMEQTLGNEINRALAGQISGKEALANAKEAWQGVLRKQGFTSGQPPVNYASVKDGLWLGRGKEQPF